MLTSATRGHLNLFFLAVANEAVVVAGSYPGLNWCLWRSNKVIYIFLDFIINISAGCISFCCQTLSADVVSTVSCCLLPERALRGWEPHGFLVCSPGPWSKVLAMQKGAGLRTCLVDVWGGLTGVICDWVVLVALMDESYVDCASFWISSLIAHPYW